MTELVPLRRNRDFVLYQSGGLLSTFGSGISGIAYPLLTLALTLGGEDRICRGRGVPTARDAERTGRGGGRPLRPQAPDDRADAAGAAALAVLGTTVLTGHATFWLVVVVAFVDTSAAVLYRRARAGP